MENLQIFLPTISFILLAIIVVFVIFSSKKKSGIKTKNNKEYTFKGIMNKSLLTPTELSFFKQLKLITDKYNLIIFPKVRMADIISTRNKRDLMKISNKHIDFTICYNNTAPLIFIELDDNSHTRKINIENDRKKDYILSTFGVKILRVKTNNISNGLEQLEHFLQNKFNKNLKV